MQPKYNDITYVTQEELYDCAIQGIKKYVFIRDWTCQRIFCKEAFHKEYMRYEIITIATILLSFASGAILLLSLLTQVPWSPLLSIALIVLILAGSIFVRWFDSQDGDKQIQYAKSVQIIAIILAILALIVTRLPILQALCIAIFPLPLSIEGYFVKVFSKRFQDACTTTTLYDYMYGKCFYLAEFHPSGLYTQLRGDKNIAKKAGIAYADGHIKVIPL